MLPQSMRLMTLSMDINTVNGWFLNKQEFSPDLTGRMQIIWTESIYLATIVTGN